MFKLQQFNNIVQTTQLINNHMLEFHCHSYQNVTVTQSAVTF